MRQPIVNAQLTAPGDGAIISVGSFGAVSAEYKVVVAAIDTNVVVCFELSNDNFSTVVETENKTITANGEYVYNLPVGYRQMRPTFKSEDGGTAATVDFTTILFK